MSIEVQREVGELLADQPLGDEDATEAIKTELFRRELLDGNLLTKLERARGIAVELTHRVDLAEQFANSVTMHPDVRAELLEILRGDR